MNVHDFDLNVVLVLLGHIDAKHSILQLRRDTVRIHLSRVRSTSESDLPRKCTLLSLVERESLQELLLARPVQDTADIELALLVVPVNRDVVLVLIGSCKRDMHDERSLGIEYVHKRFEVAARIAGFGALCLVGFLLVAENL